MDTSSILNILIFVLLAWFIYSRFAPIKGLKNLNEKEFQSELQQRSNKILIDVREPNEYKTGLIAGAINIPLSQLKNRLSEIPTNKDIYLYCRSGMRSKQAARALSKHGFSNIAHLQGGISTWKGKIVK